MKKIIKIGLLTVCMALVYSLFAGCGGQAEKMEITFYNYTEGNISALYISPTDSDDWGDNYLEEDLYDAAAVEVKGSDGIYDIQAAVGADTFYYHEVPLKEGTTVDIHSDLIIVVDSDGMEKLIEEQYATPDMAEEEEEPEEDEEYAAAEEEQLEEETPQPDPVDTNTYDWVDLTFYNSTDLRLTEILVYEMDSEDGGYNHIESIGSLEPGANFELGVDWYPGYHVELYDDTQGVMVFYDVILDDAVDAEVRWDGDSEPKIYVTYSEGTTWEFEGFYG